MRSLRYRFSGCDWRMRWELFQVGRDRATLRIVGFETQNDENKEVEQGINGREMRKCSGEETFIGADGADGRTIGRKLLQPIGSWRGIDCIFLDCTRRSEKTGPEDIDGDAMSSRIMAFSLFRLLPRYAAPSRYSDR